MPGIPLEPAARALRVVQNQPATMTALSRSTAPP